MDFHWQTQTKQATVKKVKQRNVCMFKLFDAVNCANQFTGGCCAALTEYNLMFGALEPATATISVSICTQSRLLIPN